MPLHHVHDQTDIHICVRRFGLVDQLGRTTGGPDSPSCDIMGLLGMDRLEEPLLGIGGAVLPVLGGIVGTRLATRPGKRPLPESTPPEPPE